ncbi:hypothetical protein F4802DRAFT_575789 [Xylaria palmicola]|nr:hypothetical protein F4802DRAFT_575789 [Xylaria palmicola]
MSASPPHTLQQMLKNRDPYAAYQYAKDNHLRDELMLNWEFNPEGRDKYRNFLLDPAHDAKNVCFIVYPEYDPALRSLPTQFAAERIYLLTSQQRPKEHQAVLLSDARRPAPVPVPDAPNQTMALYGANSVYQAQWTNLVRTTAKAIRRVTHPRLYIPKGSSPDYSLEAIQRTANLDSPGLHLPHVLFMAGLTRAWDRWSGYNQTQDYSDVIQTGGENWLNSLKAWYNANCNSVQQQNVTQMVSKLSELFGDGYGKLVIFVHEDFTGFCQVVDPRRATIIEYPGAYTNRQGDAAWNLLYGTNVSASMEGS